MNAFLVTFPLSKKSGQAVLEKNLFSVIFLKIKNAAVVFFDFLRKTQTMVPLFIPGIPIFNRFISEN